MFNALKTTKYLYLESITYLYDDQYIILNRYYEMFKIP